MGIAHQKQSDAIIWDDFLKGSEAAFAFIYETYAPKLYSYGRQIIDDAELVKDCIQDLYIYLWNHKANLGATDNIKLYLFKAISRRLIKYQNKNYRDKNLKEFYQQGESQMVFPFETDLIKGQEKDEKLSQLKEVFQHLSPRKQEVIYLIFYEDLSYREAADVLAINIRSVYTLTWKAISDMKRNFKHIILSLLVFLFFT